MNFAKHFMHRSKNAILLLVGIAVSVGLLGYFYQYSQRTRADANATVTFTFEASTLQAEKDGAAFLNINAASPTTSAVSIGTILIRYPKSLILYEDTDTTSCAILKTVRFQIILGSDAETFNTLELTQNSASPDNELPSGAFCFARIKFKALSEGSGQIQFAPIDTVIQNRFWDIAGPGGEYTAALGSVSSVALTVGPASTNSPTPIDQPSTTLPPQPVTEIIENRKDINTNLRLKFQGITTQPRNSSPISVQIKLVEGTKVPGSYETVSFTPQGDGAYVANHVFKNVNLSAKHSILVKGPKHLQKKICDNSPNEALSGYYRCDTSAITFKEGDNTLDLTHAILLSGDIPVQNNVVDAADIIYVRNNIGRSDAEVLTRADLNMDNIVDTQDYSLIIAALAFKYDE